MNESLRGKIAFVAGGSRGIGAAIVRRLAAEGAVVVFTFDKSTERAAALVEAVAAAGGIAESLRADSGDPEALRGAIDTAARRHGRIDILVNNAGIIIHGTVDGYGVADFDRMVAVNIRAPFIAVQAVLPHMGEGGRIVTIGSVAGDRSAFAGMSVYSMTKGAVAAMTRGLARDLGARGITINTLQPGPTATDMTPDDEAARRTIAPLIALGRLGRDEEVADFTTYLVRPGTAYVTGATLTVDGGYLA